MDFSSQSIFLIQLVGIIVAGGFIGEFYRAVHSHISISPSVFIARFLAGSFLSFLISYGIYLTINNRPFTIIFGGLLSYQKDIFIIELAKELIRKYVNSENKDLGDGQRLINRGYKKDPPKKNEHEGGDKE